MTAAIIAALSSPALAGSLEVAVTNIRNARGDIRVAVCSQATFLKEKCEYNGAAPAAVGRVVVRIDNVPEGTWAVQAYHDEDRSSDVTLNMLGLPVEGLGFSNDAPFRFGPPSYGDAAFRLPAVGGRIKLGLRYLF